MTNDFIDNIIRNYFLNIKTKNCATSLFKRKLNKLPLLSKYIDNRYNDSESWRETVWRIRNNINNKPCCKECGKELKFPFKTYCSCKCRSNNEDVINKTKETCLNQYGVEYVITNKNIRNEIQEKLKPQYKNITIKSRQTKLERYGDPNYSNIEKQQQTCLEKYGVKHPLQNEHIKEKSKQTCLEKYGVEYSLQSDIVKEKSEKTKLEKYGDQHFINHEKYKQTCLKKYGVDNSFKSEIVKKQIKETCLEKYGNENYRNVEKHKKTCLEKYGVTSYTQTEEFKNKVDWKEANIKQIKSKKKNGTLNTSKPENQSYQILKEKYKDIIHQYISNEYPFNCDFYIPSLDLYIECNYHWTHGGHPFNENNFEDQIKLNKWKNKNSKFYNNAIYVWTDLDVRKRNIAKENNLNYIEVWKLEDIYKL